MVASIMPETELERALWDDPLRRDLRFLALVHADVARDALAAHPVFADAKAVEARILHAAKAL